MRHYKKGRKLGTDKSHTKAMKRSLVTALLENDRIKTIEMRAKEIRPDVDKIITWAKKGDLHSRRLAIAALGGNKELVREIFEKVEQGMFADRNGGYTRIMKLGNRKGDNAPMVIMELVAEPVQKKTKKAAPAAEKPAAKKAEKVEEAAEDVIDVAAEEVTEEAAEAVEAVEEAAEEAAETVEEATEAAEEATEAAEEAVEEATEAAEEATEKAAE
ncbi:MAG: 50S ribosomal protein L17 [Coriobacteriia bacterium]|nr:50S ribosomal protein L17 [Coriobacteriia bacterium]